MKSDALTAIEWVRVRLRADLPAVVPIENDPGMESVTGLSVTLRLLSSVPRVAFGDVRLGSEMLLQAVAVSPGQSPETVEATARAIDEALHGRRGRCSRGEVFSCVRDREVLLPFEGESGPMQMMGGVFRIRAKGDG